MASIAENSRLDEIVQGIYIVFWSKLEKGSQCSDSGKRKWCPYSFFRPAPWPRHPSQQQNNMERPHQQN